MIYNCRQPYICRAFEFYLFVFSFTSLNLAGERARPGILKPKSNNEMEKMPIRMTLYAKDIVTITGKSESTARRMIADMRSMYGYFRYLSVEMFCRFTGLDREHVQSFLK